MSTAETLTESGAAKPEGVSQGVAWLAGGFVIVSAAIALQTGLLTRFGKKR
jgi:hypothetical protein